ncbi:MAG: AraC family transcriptional regulator [Synergistaceae bacterium]|jgi:AraC-like DNA-binding protein|nr:AraC family transcriptional regulator [Synergistaceae bacterium]
MFKHRDTVIFRDYAEFCNATAEFGSTTDMSGWSAFRCDAPFISIAQETYRLFDMVDLAIGQLLPSANIEFPYELRQDYFEIGYVTEGSFCLLTERYEDGVIRPNRLYISPPTGSRGVITCRRDAPFKTLSFYALCAFDKVMEKVLGERGVQLWDETIGFGNAGGGMYPVMSPPPDVVNSLIHVANCNYPHQVRLMFFENMLQNILLRLMAHKLPEDEKLSDMSAFEAEQIRSVPGILMRHLDLPPSIQELARELSMSATKLKRGFKKIFGKPIYAYHYGACMERAAIMLLDTNRSISEIALDSGYSASGNFGNAFKKHYGVSPIQFRRNGRCATRTFHGGGDRDAISR